MLEMLNPTPRRAAPPSLAEARLPLADAWWQAGERPASWGATPLAEPALVRPDPAAAQTAVQTAAPAETAKPAEAELGLYAAAMFDEIDYPMLMLGPDGRVRHANKLARADLAGHHPLRLDGSVLTARGSTDGQALADALQGALARGLRRLLHLGRDTPRSVSVAVIPLAAPGGGAARAVLLLLAKHQVCEALSAQAFARCHGLTPAETTVLQALCDGEQPQVLAHALGVAISTVRSQISSIRAKTGAPSIRALVRQVAVLPPLVNLIAAASR